VTDPPPASDADAPEAADLMRLVAETRTADAVRARSRERVLRQQATGEATFVGLLMDLIEAGTEISVRIRTGTTVQGRPVGMGRDFVAVRPGTGPETWIALRAIASVRSRPGRRPPDPAGERPSPGGTSLAARLASLAPERPRLAVTVAGEPAPLIGELRAVGSDVATVEVDGGPPVTAYVSLPSVLAVTVLASG
jgi:hypothetical protein